VEGVLHLAGLHVEGFLHTGCLSSVWLDFHVQLLLFSGVWLKSLASFFNLQEWLHAGL
jgi:hypothetical protein